MEAIVEWLVNFFGLLALILLACGITAVITVAIMRRWSGQPAGESKIRPNIWMLIIAGGIFAFAVIWVLTRLLTPGSTELTIAVVAGIFTLAGGYIAILSGVSTALTSHDPPPTMPASTHEHTTDRLVDLAEKIIVSKN